MHAVAPFSELYFPGEQEMHVGVPPEGLNLPFEHSLHALALAAPIAGTCVPAGQSVQEDAPVGDELNLPAAQETQVYESVAPAMELYFPKEHSVQNNSLVAPSVVLNFPATQSTQLCAKVREELCLPAAQVVQFKAPDELDVPAGQSTQELAPSKELNLPAAQTMQEDSLVDPARLDFPGLQGSQSELKSPRVGLKYPELHL